MAKLNLIVPSWQALGLRKNFVGLIKTPWSSPLRCTVMGRAVGGDEQKHDVVSEETLNERVLKAEYAVRGEIVARAGELQKELQAGKKLPFESLVFCNIGNPQSLGQKPLTFVRQVLALCDYPQVIKQQRFLRSAAAFLKRSQTNLMEYCYVAACFGSYRYLAFVSMPAQSNAAGYLCSCWSPRRPKPSFQATPSVGQRSTLRLARAPEHTVKVEEQPYLDNR